MIIVYRNSIELVFILVERDNYYLFVVVVIAL